MSFSEILLQLLLGWLLADLLTGLAHWIEDRVLWSTMPLLGRWIVIPNRLHHADPMAFLSSSAWARNNTTWAATAAVALPWLLLGGFSYVWLGALAGGLAATEIHVRAHRNAGAGPWAVLQEIGIVQSTGQHARHHRGAMDSRYCVLTDWLNPILDTAGVWVRLEAALGLIGLKPNGANR